MKRGDIDKANSLISNLIRLEETIKTLEEGEADDINGISWRIPRSDRNKLLSLPTSRFCLAGEEVKDILLKALYKMKCILEEHIKAI